MTQLVQIQGYTNITVVPPNGRYQLQHRSNIQSQGIHNKYSGHNINPSSVYANNISAQNGNVCINYHSLDHINNIGVYNTFGATYNNLHLSSSSGTMNSSGSSGSGSGSEINNIGGNINMQGGS
eukprot:10350849-Ditylum_brightwellii.AAC.1